MVRIGSTALSRGQRLSLKQHQKEWQQQRQTQQQNDPSLPRARIRQQPVGVRELSFYELVVIEVVFVFFLKIPPRFIIRAAFWTKSGTDRKFHTAVGANEIVVVTQENLSPAEDKSSY